MNYFDEANSLYKEKEYEKAILLYQKAIENKDNIAASLYNAAICFIKLKEFEEAVPLLKQAIKENGSSKYYFNLAYCYAMLKDNKKSLINFNTAWALDNDDEDSCKAINIIISKLDKITNIKNKISDEKIEILNEDKISLLLVEINYALDVGNEQEFVELTKEYNELLIVK